MRIAGGGVGLRRSFIVTGEMSVFMLVRGLQRGARGSYI